jgi:hypothetical protein
VAGKKDFLNLSVRHWNKLKLEADLSNNPDLCCVVGVSKSDKKLGVKLLTILKNKTSL